MKNFKKILALILALVMLLTMAACSNHGDTSLSDVIDAKKIVIGMDDSFTPVCYRNENNELCGIAPKIAQEFAVSLDSKAEIKIVDTNDAISALDKGTIDCYIGYPNLDYQTGLLVESMSMQFERNFVVIVPSDSDIGTLYDLHDKNVAVVANTDAAAVLTNTTEFRSSLKEILAYQTEQEALEALDSGLAQGAAFEEAFILWILKSEPEKYQIIDQTLQSGNYYILFKKDAKQLYSRIDQIYSLLSSRGQLEDIFHSEMSETDIEIIEDILLTQSQSDLLFGFNQPVISKTDTTPENNTDTKPAVSTTDTSSSDISSTDQNSGQ